MILAAIRKAEREGLPIQSDINGCEPLPERDKHRILGLLLSNVEADNEAAALLKEYRENGLAAALDVYTARRVHTKDLKRRARMRAKELARVVALSE